MAENHAREAEISRGEQDAFALRSHQRAVAAIDAGRFRDEIVPLTVQQISGNGNGRPTVTEIEFAVDEGPRRETSLEALGKLKPAFHAQGHRDGRQLLADERRRGRRGGRCRPPARPS